ncbi:MAG: signal peptide peptidase SppA [Eubacteriales bacterium]
MENIFKNTKNRNIVIWVTVLIVIMIVGVFIKFVIGWNGEFLKFGEKPNLISPKSDYIGILYIEGTIMKNQTDNFGLPIGYQHQWTLDQIKSMKNDNKNTGLIIYVDSPGGGVYESDELYLAIENYKKVTGRPVYSYMASMAASGGYYISCASDKIIANRNTWTGSIGVTIGTIYDISGLLDRYGIKSVTITSGKNKAMGDYTKPMPPEQLAIFHSLVDEAYEQFIGIVADGRKLDIETVRKIADGRIYTAKQAKDLKLIDRIGTLDDAVNDIRSTYNLQNSKVLDITYVNNSVLGMLFSKAGNLVPKSEASDILRIMDKKQGMEASYIFAW